MKRIFRIALTGGACGGKTTALSRLATEIASLGYGVLIVPETATTLINAGIRPATTKKIVDCDKEDKNESKSELMTEEEKLNFEIKKINSSFSNPLLNLKVPSITQKGTISVVEFQRLVLQMQINMEALFINSACYMKEENIVILHDRGIMDGESFLDEKTFEKLLKEQDLTKSKVFERYDIVLHLVTAADGAEEYYTLENNSARTETCEQARELDNKTKQAWNGHPKLKIIGNNCDFDTKIDKAMEEVYNLLKFKIPLDIQKRYLVEFPALEDFPEDIKITSVGIVQNYLREKYQMIRKILRNGEEYYHYIEKIPVDNSKDYVVERIISKIEYDTYLRRINPMYSQIDKTRIYFIYNNQYFELDLYSISEKYGVLQVRVTSKEKEVEIPKFIKVIKEVTDDEMYRSYNISKTNKIEP